LLFKKDTVTGIMLHLSSGPGAAQLWKCDEAGSLNVTGQVEKIGIIAQEHFSYLCDRFLGVLFCP
jgi:hypothetical protein